MQHKLQQWKVEVVLAAAVAAAAAAAWLLQASILLLVLQPLEAAAVAAVTVVVVVLVAAPRQLRQSNSVGDSWSFTVGRQMSCAPLQWQSPQVQPTARA